MKLPFTLMLVLLAQPVLADDLANAPERLVCGGNHNGEELKFNVNPLNKVISAYTANEEFMVFIDATRGETVRLIYGEVVKDSVWEKMKALRDASDDQEFKDMLSTLGSTKTTEMWVGWSKDNYLHFESKQRESKFTFSCQRT